MIKDPIFKAYCYQKNTAKRRRIPWHFTFETWVKWWEEQLGPNWFKLRGRNAGQTVMSRPNDQGPYAPGIVQCITCTANHRNKTHVGRKGFLTRKQVLAIFNAPDVRPAARRFHVGLSTVLRIKSGKAYSNVTGKRM